MKLPDQRDGQKEQNEIVEHRKNAGGIIISMHRYTVSMDLVVPASCYWRAIKKDGKEVGQIVDYSISQGKPDHNPVRTLIGSISESQIGYTQSKLESSYCYYVEWSACKILLDRESLVSLLMA